MILDIFSTELYTHCLIRKLAIFKIYQIKPSPILGQFVDIHLDLAPTNRVGEAQERKRERVLTKLHSIDGMNFNLKQNIKKHGPLEKVAELVFDEHSSFLKCMEDIKKLVERFREDCRKHNGEFGALLMSWQTVYPHHLTTSRASTRLSNYLHPN